MTDAMRQELGRLDFWTESARFWAEHNCPADVDRALRMLRMALDDLEALVKEGR